MQLSKKKNELFTVNVRENKCLQFKKKKILIG